MKETRSVIRRWQAARGLQHKALLSEIVASLQRGDEEPESHASRHRSGGGRHYYRSSGGGGGGGFPLFGGLMGDLFGRH